MKAKVNCGIFNYNKRAYKNGDVIDVDEKLGSIKTLFKMKDLIPIESKKIFVKKEEPIVEEPIVEEPIVEEHKPKKKKSKRKSIFE